MAGSVERYNTSRRKSSLSGYRGHGKTGSFVDTVVDLVRAKVLTEMDGRDLVRCLATERSCGVAVFCVSQEHGAVYEAERHLESDFNCRDFVKQLKEHVHGGRFDQIVLDYFWIPSGWNESHWRRPFFAKSLVAFAEADILTPVARHPEFLENGCRKGVVYLPFCLHCLKEVVALTGKLSKLYDVSFLSRGQLHENALWAGTQTVDPSLMESVFRKQLSQEDIYCTITQQQLRTMQDEPHVTKAVMLDFVRRLGDVSAVRFIVLELLPLERNTGRGW